LGVCRTVGFQVLHTEVSREGMMWTKYM